MRNPSGGIATEWETNYRVNRITGAVEVIHTDLGNSQASFNWRPTTNRITSNVWWYRLLP